MNSKLVVLIGAVGLAGIGAINTPAIAQERLLLTSMSPAGSKNDKFFNAWAGRINDAAGGTANVVVRNGTTIANFGNVYDRVKNDVVQIGWAITTTLGGQFPLTSVVTLPFEVEDNAACSAALWRLYESGHLDDEYAEVQPIYFNCFLAQYLHFRKAPKTVDTLAGTKLFIISKVAADWAKELGATPISGRTGEMYEMLQKNNVDAVQTSWAAFLPYNLWEVTQYHLEQSTGSLPGVVFMMKSKFKKLPEAARRALMENGGEKRSREWGVYSAENQEIARSRALKEGHVIAQLTDAQKKAWKAAMDKGIAGWTEIHGEKGQKVAEFFPKLYRELATTK